MNKQTFLWGSIPSEWTIQNLNELTTYISRGKQPKYVDYSEIRALNQKAIRWGFIDNSVLKYHNPEVKVDEKHFIKKGDVVINSTGTGTVGRTYYFGYSPEQIFADSHVTLVRTNSEVLNPQFLMYQLSTKAYQHFIEGSFLAGSTGQVEFNKSKVQQLPILLPTISEQNSIVNILSSLDDKIELNNQMNETLEEIAEGLFKRWFVDFEFPNEEGQPYKSSGGEMVESKLGMIPKGWSIGFFRDYMVDILGGDWGKEEATGNYNKAVYCLRGADIPEIRVGRKGKMPRRYILEKNYLKKKLTNGDLVVEISGGSPTQSTGRITYISKALLEKYDLDIVSTNFCRAITLKDIYMTEFYYYYWNYLYNNDVFFQYENGTTGIKNLDINSFLDKFSIVQPPKELLKIFHDKINIILLLVQANGEENEKLAHVRDTLLPKLMSGEIRVSDFES